MRLFASGLLSAVLAGCGGLHRDAVPAGQPAGCPRQTAAALIANQDALGPSSATPELECALGFVRGSDDPVLRRSSLGSRLCLHLAERDSDPAERERFAWEGVKLAETALAQGGKDDGAVHYYLAANLGLAVRDDMTVAMANLHRLEDEFEAAVRLSPDVDDGGPLRLLGMLYLKAPPWPAGIGDGDKALDLLQRAVDKHPAHPLNHLFYAQALWEVNGEGRRVKEEMAAGMKLLESGHWGYNKKPWKQEFADLREEIGEPVR
ncbi:sterol transporter outer membrane protein BstC [Methylococcus geothermalis]|uniref:sterol transporter outer membrane protein BstC n=1 Tax=Methylococcus geothermalis TaxID=2681310 RepID=UPI001E38D512|nr:sterol transporter outer membrane protein BstC [Methylococcus geothermalis]